MRKTALDPAEVPHDFNPFVHSGGRRGMRLGELIEHARGFVSGAGGGGDAA